MALSDILKTSQLKEKIESLEKENASLKQLFTPEMQEALNLQKKIEELNQKIAYLNNLSDELRNETIKFNKMVDEKKSQIIWMDDEIMVQEFGLYQPKYDFENSEMYKLKLSNVRDLQKQAIKHNRAVTGSVNWTVNGDVKQGKKMVSDMQKLLLRAFNGECDELINKVKYNNFDASLNRMKASKEAISKLGVIMSVSVTSEYYNLKIEELRIALEYQIKKQEEKEAAKLAREEMREAAKLQKELEEQRKKSQRNKTIMKMPSLMY